MSAVIAEVHLPDHNGVPADDAINTFVFANSATGAEPATTAFNVADALEHFYNAGADTAHRVQTYLAANLDNGAGKAHIIFYQLAAAGSIVPHTPLGGPILDHPFTIATGTGTGLPRESAVVLSLSAPHAGIAEDVPGGVAGPKGDTHPAARHRGRVYIGPLDNAALGAGVNGPGVSAACRDALAAAAALLMTNVNTIAGGTHYWGIWSRKDSVIYPITSGYIDDAFDTQRRRGIGATARTTWG
jgi:hypothetical protein